MGIETAFALNANQQSKAAKKAANAQTEAAGAANALEREMWQQGREDMSPWLKQGQASLSQLGDLTKTGGQFMQKWNPTDLGSDPGYQFRLGEAERGANRALAARGLSNSGSAFRELSRVNQGMASEEANNAYNREMQQRMNMFNMLSGLANTGQATAQQLGNAGSQYASAYGQNLGQAANARASQYVAKAQANSNALNGFLDLAMNAAEKFGGG